MFANIRKKNKETNFSAFARLVKSDYDSDIRYQFLKV